jgi:hypothetical protein
VATLTWIRDRIAHSLDSNVRVRVDRRLIELQADVADGELAAAVRTLRALLAAATAASSPRGNDVMPAPPPLP